MTGDTRPRRPWPIGLLSAFVLIAAGESFVSYHSLDFTSQQHWEWRLSGRASTRQARNAGLLVLGSSLVKLGVSPRVIETESGLRCYNLGLCAGSPVTSFNLLRRAVESGCRPSTVLVEFHPNALSTRPGVGTGFWPELLTTRETFELACAARDADFLAAVCASLAAPSLAQRHRIRECVVAAVQGQSRSERLATLALMDNTRRNLGNLLVPKAPSAVDRPSPHDDLSRKSGSWKVDPVQHAYLNRLFELARRHSIRIVWLIPPVSPGLQSLRDRNGTEAAYRDYAHREVRSRNGVRVLDGRTLGLRSDEFIDAQHLDRDGAFIWSRAIAATLADPFLFTTPGPLWVELSRSGFDHVRSNALVDFGQSVDKVKVIAHGATTRTRR